jgi:hypothetical protein
MPGLYYLFNHMSIFNLSSEQLRRAADLKEKIGMLEKELAVALGHMVEVAAAVVTTAKAMVPNKKQRKKISAAGLARIKAAQKARWAKYKKEMPAAAPVPARKKKFTMSAAAKAKIAAAARARWAKIKAAKNA